MGDGIIKVNEEIDQVVQNLDGVVGSYEKGIAELAGANDGVANSFYRAMIRGRIAIEDKFNAIDTILEQVTEAMKASIEDHRATEAEISDEVLRRLNEIAEAETPPEGSSSTQQDEGASGSGRTVFSGGKF